MDEKEFPYRVEYAKSDRSSCKICKNKIAKDSLRIATVVQVRKKITHFIIYF